MATRDALHFSPFNSQQIDPYISRPDPFHPSKPFVTLTFATSLDSQLSLAPGVQTALSGPDSKAMTHYLRSKHDAILIGVGTAIADDPSLNCRIEGVGGYGGEGLEGQPRPVVIDPKGRWAFTEDSKVIRLAREGKGKAPWVVTQADIGDEKKKILESIGGRILAVSSVSTHVAPLDWADVLTALAREHIRSAMIEGGGRVINDLLSSKYFNMVDSVIVTIAPTWLGEGGVRICPEERVEDGRQLPVGRLTDVKWIPLGEDVVLCGRPKLS
ncbi:5-amino-6-uracil reductase-like protein [Plenodomus tracheiphilus IPT5]|uniref:2,5-diamino-6-ribosylamino-4(3H)-pyrimidinone 5'-phosphate reductase n=1 Tax=Plenodomus tracheiphilus IPT5 TaxID=1408161 RepID=A0A6A7BF20_9PLEO|nr:5-amino-6-uracil reductase-like protein [Plenodomus tracheiphilus IPT5]